MKAISIISILFSVLFFASCKKYKEAHIEVVNNVHNVRLYNISFDDIALRGDLLPGESSGKILISDEYENISFPISGQIEFYMMGSSDARVYLRTKESFTLNKNDDLKIIISDDTEVVNSLTSSIRTLADIQ